jgi:hypothetical protein
MHNRCVTNTEHYGMTTIPTTYLSWSWGNGSFTITNKWLDDAHAKNDIVAWPTWTVVILRTYFKLDPFGVRSSLARRTRYGKFFLSCSNRKRTRQASTTRVKNKKDLCFTFTYERLQNNCEHQIYLEYVRRLLWLRLSCVTYAQILKYFYFT